MVLQNKLITISSSIIIFNFLILYNHNVYLKTEPGFDVVLLLKIDVIRYELIMLSIIILGRD